nr:hypothetical protein [Tanacetum cinerariifolium]
MDEKKTFSLNPEQHQASPGRSPNEAAMDLISRLIALKLWSANSRSMMRKLKYLKVKIQEWNNGNRNNTKRVIEKYKEELDALDSAIYKGNGSDDIVNKGIEVKEKQGNDKIKTKSDKNGKRGEARQDNIISGLPSCSAITPNEHVLSIEEPDNSLSMGDEHLDTIPATESDEVIKSSVENLIPIPNQFEDFYDSNVESSSTDDDSFSIDKIDYVEASLPDSKLVSSEKRSMHSLLLKMNPLHLNFLNRISTWRDVPEKIFSTPLFDEEIIPMKIDQHHHNAESDLMESLHTHDSSLLISSKIDSLLDEFVGELTLLKSIPPGIDETDCDFEEDIRLIKKLLYDNSSPHPPKEFVSANSDVEIESFSLSPILLKDSDSLMEEIDLSCTLDYPMSPGIKDDDYDSERDIFILKDFPSNDTLSIHEIKSFHFDIPSFSHPPAKPPDAICYMPDDDSWKEQSYLGCSFVSFLSPLINSSMGELGQAQRPKTSASWEVKEKQRKDKIRTKPDKNGKRGEARQCHGQSQSRKQEKRGKYKVEGPKMQILQVVFIKD